MASFEVRFDKSSGKVCYKNRITNASEQKDPSAVGTKLLAARVARQAQQWDGEEAYDEGAGEWDEGAGEWEEDHLVDQSAYQPFPQNPYLPRPSPVYAAPRHIPVVASRQRAIVAPHVQELRVIAQRLPPNWEVRVDEASGELYYVDHVRKTCTWEPPALPTMPRNVKQGPPLVPGTSNLLDELVELKAQQAALNQKMQQLQRKMQVQGGVPSSINGPAISASKPAGKSKSSKKVKIQEPAAASAKKQKQSKLLLNFDQEETESFVNALQICPEGTFEHFCRRQVRELPGVQLEDCKAHWLVTPPSEQMELIEEQKLVLQQARAIFNLRMQEIGLKDLKLLEHRWKTLSWKDKQFYFQEAEEQLGL